MAAWKKALISAVAVVTVGGAGAAAAAGQGAHRAVQPTVRIQTVSGTPASHEAEPGDDRGMPEGDQRNENEQGENEATEHETELEAGDDSSANRGPSERSGSSDDSGRDGSDG